MARYGGRSLWGGARYTEAQHSHPIYRTMPEGYQKNTAKRKIQPATPQPCKKMVGKKGLFKRINWGKVNKSYCQEKHRIPNKHLHIPPALQPVFPLEYFFAVSYFSVAPLPFTLHNTTQTWRSRCLLQWKLEATCS